MSVPYSKRLLILKKVETLLKQFNGYGNELFCLDTEQSNSKDVAYIVHAYYTNVAFQLFNKIENTKEEFDIYITCPRNSPPYFYQDVFLRFPYAKILHVDNKGRDILPWLKLNRTVDMSKYRAICKLHTKKSPHSKESGEYGLNTAINGLIKDSDTITKNIKITSDNKCMLASSNAIAVISEDEKTEKFTIYVNRLLYIVKKIHLNNSRNMKALVPDISLSNLKFVAGTMFWYNPESVKKLLDLDLQDSIFEEEPLEPDGNIPHAVERLFGWSSKSIIEV
jgi:lipopolysaccharide biosynthesis protein